MKSSDVVHFLSNCEVPTPHFRWSAPPTVAPHMATALAPTWLKLSMLLASLRVQRYAAVGCLVGTMESCAIQNHGWSPSLIAFFDLDIPAYNPQRDTGAYAYVNVCSFSTSNFQGEFIYARVDSTNTECIAKLGPYDCVLVDGCHSYDALVKDMSTVYSSLTPGGMMLVHDLELPGTHLDKAYFDWLKANDCDHAEVTGDTVVLGLGVVMKPTV